MPDPTIPELVAWLRELLSKAHPLPWLYRGKSDSLHVAPPEPPYSYGAGFLRLTEYDDAEETAEDIDLILEAVNALPTLLDALERGTDALARAWEEGAEAALMRRLRARIATISIRCTDARWMSSTRAIHTGDALTH